MFDSLGGAWLMPLLRVRTHPSRRAYLTEVADPIPPHKRYRLWLVLSGWMYIRSDRHNPAHNVLGARTGHLALERLAQVLRCVCRAVDVSARPPSGLITCVSQDWPQWRTMPFDYFGARVPVRLL